MKVYLLLWICAACDGAAGRRQTYQKVRAHHEHERHLEATTAAPTKAPTKVPLPNWYYEWEGAVIPTGGECTTWNPNTAWQCESPGYCGNCTNIPQISTAGFWAKETIDDLDDPQHGSQRNVWTKPVVVRESSTTCYCLDAATWKAEKDYCPSGKFAHVYAGSTCEDSCPEFPCCKNKWNRVIDCPKVEKGFPESCTDTIFNVQKRAKERAEDGCYIDDGTTPKFVKKICKNKNGEVITCPASCTDGKRTYGIDRGAGNAFSPKFTVESETDVDCGGDNECPRCADSDPVQTHWSQKSGVCYANAQRLGKREERGCLRCYRDSDCESGYCAELDGGVSSHRINGDLIFNENLREWKDMGFCRPADWVSGGVCLLPSFLTIACLLLASSAVQV